MELSEQQRQAISDHCLPTSWQMLSAWRLQHLGSLNDGPELVARWLGDAPMRSQALAQDMARSLSQRPWWIDTRAHATTQAAAAQAGTPRLRTLVVVCGSQRWTLWLQPRGPQPLLRISA